MSERLYDSYRCELWHINMVYCNRVLCKDVGQLAINEIFSGKQTYGMIYCLPTVNIISSHNRTLTLKNKYF